MLYIYFKPPKLYTMAWGISPRKTIIVPLNNYDPNHYLTLLYHAFNNLNWHIGYFNRDGIIAYSNISWQSFAEEISVRIVNNSAIIKSECVGYQFLFYDYGKNELNLDLLFNEISYVEFHLQETLELTTQQLIDSIPENQFISLDNPPLGYKERLKGFLTAFTPKPSYLATPLLILGNIAIYIIITIMMIAKIMVLQMLAQQGTNAGPLNMEEIYLTFGFSNRAQVLNGEVWRLLSNTFLHFSIMHIAGNMIVLIYIGSLIEVKLGKWNYIFIYLFAGICASITSVMWHDEGVMAGASGAIFGLFGVLLALLSTPFYERNARRALLISTGIFVVYSILPIGRHVDHAAHFGGLTAGYLFGLMAYFGLKKDRQKLFTSLTGVITLVYTACCIWLAPVYQFKELQQLTRQTDRISTILVKDFYLTDSLSRDERLHLLQSSTILKLDTLNSLAKKITGLTLPKKQKEVAEIRSKIIRLEGEMYGLLYKEFVEKDKTKYRERVYAITQQINDLRFEWGKMEQASEKD